ncbi:NADP-dependent oxidoreductase [Pseudomonas sp. MAP12]|uniref:NADP-dependent oxidoreductase n=1 Tax=Geopseudomonas aromaticivorans TaxID=2849492 RepID=A0ABS6MVY0_9GAMM|nr:NADP-dependent oxidoreductase [Pseudomonas aromaticivorans]MBV2132506.1 NADP-dependent oxidoreductase [Pseudomonas aromaticivorans]
MPELRNRSWILQKRPEGLVTLADIELREEPLRPLQAGEVLIRNHYLSIDPAIRDWMSERPSYLPSIPLGEVVRSTSLGEVIDSRHPAFKAGDLAVGVNGWEDYSIARGEQLMPVQPMPGEAEQYFLSIYGAVGLTAYFGFLEKGRPQPGETVLVSAAGGAVGSLVGQIARLKGCRAVGLAGSEEKCRWIVDELGFDAAINYRTSANLEEAIREACPEGVDVYFDNVGGEVLDATLMNLNKNARIVFCGAISGYNSQQPVPGPYNFWQILARTVTLEGFLVSDYFERFPEAIAQVRQWLAEGKITFREQVVDGLEHCLDTFNLLFEGANTGKLIVRLAPTAEAGVRGNSLSHATEASVSAAVLEETR